MLAASSDDDSIRVWNTKNPAAPTPVATLTGLANPTSVAWEPGKQTLVGAAPDGTLLTGISGTANTSPHRRRGTNRDNAASHSRSPGS